MPISPDRMKLYPGGSIRSKEWLAIVAEIRERSGNRCEGSPAYPDCRAENGEPHPVTGSTVVLTVAHLNHDPRDSDRANLRHWCQRCHNTYDRPYRAEGATVRRHAERGQPDLFGRQGPV